MIYDESNLENIIEYINSELLKGRTMKDIEENDFNVNERVIAKRLGRKNIKKINGQFELPSDYENQATNQIRKDINKISVQENNTTPVPTAIDIANLNLMENKDFIDLNEKVQFLELVIEELSEKNYTQDDSNNTKDNLVNDTELNIYHNEDRPVAKTVRLYKEIWDKIDKVKAKYPHLSYQTVLNSLLKEVTDKYL